MKEISDLDQVLNELSLSKLDKERIDASLNKIRSQVKRIEFVKERITYDNKIVTNFLNTTIKELELTNIELKNYQQKIIEEKEKALRLKETQLEQIVNAMPYSLAYIDMDHNYQIYNNTYKEWFGLSDNALGQNINEVSNKKKEDIFEHLLTTIKEKKEQIVFNNFIDKNGQKLIVRNSIIPALDVNSNIIGAYVFGEDLTNIKAKEKVIENQNTSLKKYIESNMQLENFAYLASHDLRSPLVNIMNFSNLLSESASTKLTDVELKFLGFIKDSSKRMEAFIRDLLSFSLIESHSIKKTSVNLKDLIDEILFDLNSSIVKAQAKISMSALDVNLKTDRFLVKSLFQNLISNAIKFVKPNTVPVIKINLTNKSKCFIVSIEDNGIGISKEYIEQIFIIFKRLNRQQDYKGTGIGLSICKSVIEKLEGEIWVENNENYGSTFYVKILKENE